LWNVAGGNHVLYVQLTAFCMNCTVYRLTSTITWTFDGIHFLANRMQQRTVTQQTTLTSSRSLCRHLATWKCILMAWQR